MLKKLPFVLFLMTSAPIVALTTTPVQPAPQSSQTAPSSEVIQQDYYQRPDYYNRTPPSVDPNKVNPTPGRRLQGTPLEHKPMKPNPIPHDR